MSFGEPAARSSGFLRRVIDDAVLRHGVTFIASAGNAGPALQVLNPLLTHLVASFSIQSKPMYYRTSPPFDVSHIIMLLSSIQTVGAPGGTWKTFLQRHFVTFLQERSAVSSASLRTYAIQPFHPPF
jgi:hypothetical protein